VSDVCWTRTTVGGPNYLGGSVTSEVHWTRTTVGGPNDLGGSVTAGIGAKPISADVMRHFQK
jgi:hypothetical protein